MSTNILQILKKEICFMKKTLIIFVVLLSMLWASGAWAQLKKGLWEITSQLEFKGTSQSTPPTTIRRCITKSESVPQNKDKRYDCKTTSQKIEGNTVSYTVECKNKGGMMETSGTTTYTDNSMNGASTANSKMKGRPEIQITNKIKGKYIGVCPK
jgi:hypothetical protein